MNMIDINEFEHALMAKKLLESKIKENTKLIKEKEKNINEAFNGFYNPKVSNDSITFLEMVNSINYDNSIKNVADRQFKRYLTMMGKPYFGRVDFENDWGDKAYYFGIETLMDNNEVFINDWRSPIASLYYDGSCGEAKYEAPSGVVLGKISLKRQYQFEKGELVNYVDNLLNIDDKLLIDVLGKNNSVVMKNIVSTIQKEQNGAIRYMEDNDLLVLGVAGSGKTSIALHRIAYLVYKDAIKYDSSKVCFITPNEIFFKYIDNVLPELGEDNVVNFTLNELARVILKMELYKNKYKLENKIDFLEKIVKSKEIYDFDSLFEKLNEFLDNKMNELFTCKIGLKIGDLYFKNDLLKELYFNKFKRRDYYTRKRYIKEFIKDRVSVKRKITNNIISTINSFVDKLLPEVDYFEIYKEFLNSIGDDSEVIHKNIILYEHVFPLCYIKLFFKKCSLFEKYNHLLIDEYQDLNVFERKVVDMTFLCNKTFVGDINQKLFKQDYELLEKEFKVIKLNNSYRSTIEIFDFLNNIIESNGVNGVKRHGKPIVLKRYNSVEEEITFIKNEILSYKGNSLAIICKSYKEAFKLYQRIKDDVSVSLLSNKSKGVIRGVVVGSTCIVKGLEFDKVIVFDGSIFNYSSEMEKNYFYINCSRAINELVITSSDEFTRFIGDNYEKGF